MPQCESDTGMWILSLMSLLPTPSPPHRSRSPQSADPSSLRYIAAPHWLADTRACACVSTAPWSRPPSPRPACPQICSLHLQLCSCPETGSSVPCVCVNAWCFFLSFWPHSVQQALASPISVQLTHVWEPPSHCTLWAGRPPALCYLYSRSLLVIYLYIAVWKMK